VPMRQWRRETTIRPMQTVAHLCNGNATIASVFVFTCVVGKIVSGPRARLADRLLCPSVNL
jgi:hypothetical protein